MSFVYHMICSFQDAKKLGLCTSPAFVGVHVKCMVCTAQIKLWNQTLAFMVSTDYTGF